MRSQTATVRDRLAAQVAEIGSTPPDELPWRALGTALTDTLAVGCAGADTAIAAGVRRELRGAPGPARVWGTDERVDAPQAALFNGIAAHVLELDDIYAPGTVHPGSVVIPAALAVADALGASGEELARAVTAGYEVCGRLAADLGPPHYRHWHTTGTAGAVGAAAAASLLHGNAQDATRSALALAATMSGGLQQLFRHDASGKPLHAGHAAMAGVLAAMAARAGMGGPSDIFEGAAGMAAAMGATGRWDNVFRETGPFCIEQTTVKPYPCCGHTFAAIDGALEARSRVPLDEVAAITVRTYQAAVDVAGIPVPASGAECRFSIPFLVAIALTDGAISRDELTPSRLGDRRFAKLVSMVELRVDEEFESAFPHHRGAEIVLETRAGEPMVVRIPDRRGSPANPISADQLRSKFTGLLAGLPEIERDAFHDQLMNLTCLDSARSLTIPTGVKEGAR